MNNNRKSDSEFMNIAIREQLIELAEPEYQAFSSKLLPGTTNIRGIRIPNLRKIAKQIVKEDWRMYLSEASDDSCEYGASLGHFYVLCEIPG